MNLVEPDLFIIGFVLGVFAMAMLWALWRWTERRASKNPKPQPKFMAKVK